ncbi:DUF2514 family protein [Pseudomonas koreensis]|uniref:DUF2514 family protein n=1 Tax=Pseudomonas koreensis TaxID=198620 RepID=UPI0018E6C50E|nr:DUF2514 family protein [Pseudomonas koreensis]MBI6948899.1 DUF2514 domain-containing protein [Pseudomonas koreensis]
MVVPWRLAVALLLAGAALLGSYRHGLTVKDAEWVGRWNDRNTLDAKAWAANETAARAKEQAYQHSIDKAVQDGQRTIDQLTADAATARVAADGLRGTADKLAARLAASQAGGHSCTAATSAAATRAVMVLADLFKRADERAGDLAGYAQDSHARGVICEQAHDGMSGSN